MDPVQITLVFAQKIYERKHNDFDRKSTKSLHDSTEDACWGDAGHDLRM
jgi:hypothetical protein